MKCHIMFSGKNKKNISKYRLLKILSRVLSVKQSCDVLPEYSTIAKVECTLHYHEKCF